MVLEDEVRSVGQFRPLESLFVLQGRVQAADKWSIVTCSVCAFSLSLRESQTDVGQSMSVYMYSFSGMIFHCFSFFFCQETKFVAK